MKRRDLLLVLLVILIWGVNFTVVKLGVADVPPMVLAAARYVLALFPAIFLVKKPAISLPMLLSYGLTVGVGQYAPLFYAMAIGMPAGVSSVLLQSQAIFTFLMAAAFLKEPTRPGQLAGLAIAVLGLALMGAQSLLGRADGIPPAAFLMIIASAASFGASNIIARLASRQAVRRGQTLDMFALVVWSCLVPPLPLLGIALLLDSPQAILASLQRLNGMAAFSMLYLAYAATLLGFGIWNVMLGRYEAGRMSPMLLLVPVVGVLTSVILLGERLSSLQWAGISLILGGLVILNRLAPRPQISPPATPAAEQHM